LLLRGNDVDDDGGDCEDFDEAEDEDCSANRSEHQSAIKSIGS
jgi:hypothetical protein